MSDVREGRVAKAKLANGDGGINMTVYDDGEIEFEFSNAGMHFEARLPAGARDELLEVLTPWEHVSDDAEDVRPCREQLTCRVHGGYISDSTLKHFGYFRYDPFRGDPEAIDG